MRGKRNSQKPRHQLRHLLFGPFSGHVLILVGAALLVRSDLYDLTGEANRLISKWTLTFSELHSRPLRFHGHWEAASRRLENGTIGCIVCYLLLREFDVVILKTIPHFLTYRGYSRCQCLSNGKTRIRRTTKIEVDINVLSYLDIRYPKHMDCYTLGLLNCSLQIDKLRSVMISLRPTE